jgi:polyphosphate kinase 2 (PPK2 family)
MPKASTRYSLFCRGWTPPARTASFVTCLTRVNPQGVKVASFKVPTAVELAHDFLWRIHRQTPGSGEIVIFNRSHL